MVVAAAWSPSVALIRHGASLVEGGRHPKSCHIANMVTLAGTPLGLV